MTGVQTCALPIYHPGLAEEIGKQADYFETNMHRMQYPEFRERGFFVGSGVIEAGCKSIVGVRLKQSGMFWTVRGANAIIALRCAGSIGGSKTSGRRPAPPDLPCSHFYVAHPGASCTSTVADVVERRKVLLRVTSWLVFTCRRSCYPRSPALKR